jgi:hypothetical protein
MKLHLIKDDWYSYGAIWGSNDDLYTWSSWEVPYEEFLTAHIYDNLMQEGNDYIASIYERDRENPSYT